MNKPLIAVTFCLILSLAMPIRANAGGAPPALVSADWSVNAAHNLASNPPSLDAVEDFTGRAIGESEDNPPVDVCEFRFADLRSSGDLSLIVSVDPGRGCTELYIFDKTPTGFELYHPTASRIVVAHNLANSVLDINHDGRHELVLWAALAPFATGFSFGKIGCEAEWPLIFAWTGNGYSAEVGDQYKDYYRNYLKSVEARLAADAQGYPCARIEAARTEAFLGIDSASTMSAAIRGSESDNPNDRIVAAVIFSHLGTQEAEQDLKTLGNDADSRVAGLAKETASFGEDPSPSARTTRRGVVSLVEHPIP